MFRPRKFFGRELSKNILNIKTVIGEPIYPRLPVTDGKTCNLDSVEEMKDKARQWMKIRIDEYHHRTD